MSRKWNQPPRFIRVNYHRIQKQAIEAPTYKYEVVAQPILKTVFTGHVMAVPTVLMFFLRPSELKIAAIIIQENMESGDCVLTSKQFAIRLCTTCKNVYATMYTLRKLGVIYEKRFCNVVHRAVDFSAVQHLNDLIEIEDRGIYTRLRHKTKLKNIKNITREDVQKCYDQYVLAVDHDIEEEEEYD